MIERRQLKKGVSWRVRHWLPDGTERSRSFPSKREAVAYEAEVNSARQSRTYIDPRRSRMTVGMLWPLYLSAQQSRLKPKTLAGYVFEWEKRVRPQWQATRLDQISWEAVQDWVLVMGSGVGPSSVRYAFRVFSLLLDFGVRSQRIASNPAKNVALPRLERKPPRFLTVKQVEDLAAAAGETSIMYADLVRLMAYSGLRAGEVVALRVEDVDLSTGKIHVRHNAPTIAGRIVEGTPKTAASLRTVQIVPQLREILERRTEGRASPALIFHAPTNSASFLRIENMRRDTRWPELVSRLGLDGMTVHHLRHTFASLARASGADLTMVQKLMGHASITTTARVYADIFEEEYAEFANRFGHLPGA